MKKTKRKGFNFYRSYYDVFNELPENDRLEFITALLDKQFLDLEPNNLSGVLKIVWISLYNSIDQQVKGYKTKSKDPMQDPTQGCTEGCTQDPSLQEKEKEKEKEVVLCNETVDEYISKLKTQQQFLEGLYMTYKFKNKTIGKIALKFKAHLNMYPKNHKDFEEFKSHFRRWINLSIKHNELGEYLKHQKGEL